MNYIQLTHKLGINKHNKHKILSYMILESSDFLGWFYIRININMGKISHLSTKGELVSFNDFGNYNVSSDKRKEFYYFKTRDLALAAINKYCKINSIVIK